jgi:o-succinylbenzoate synthase
VIRAARLLQHSRTLKAAARSAAGTWTERAGLTLVLEDDAGHVGLGEASPLPGFSPDALAEARAALLTLMGAALPDYSRRDVRAALSDAAQPLSSAAARFALETALLDLWARQTNVPAWSLLHPEDGSNPPDLSLSLWLPHNRDAALADAHAALVRGIRSFKVKLDGRDALDPGFSILEALRANLGVHVELRADANRSFTADQARKVAPRLAELGVVWVEEPTAEAPSGGWGMPVALDESLVGARPNLPELRAAGVTALVLKPTLLGGLSPCLKLASAAAEAGITSVVSHTLEGPLGAMGTAALALALGPGRPADGLAPHGGLSGVRPPCFEPGADRLVAWQATGLGLSLGQALAGTTSIEEVRA